MNRNASEEVPQSPCHRITVPQYNCCAVVLRNCGTV
jgi:hypothetical protein